MEKQIFADLYVVIVNHNLKRDTIECVESYLEAKVDIKRIIIVDNASTDGSLEAIGGKYGNLIKTISIPQNKGYPHALNMAIPYALEMGAKWILFSNNDVVVDRDFLNEMELVVKSDSQVALISPLILYYSEPNIIWYLGHHIIPGTLIGYDRYRGKQLSNKLPAVMQTDMLNGCAMAVRKDVFDRIGVFDDSQLIYGDDTDFSWRAKINGFKAVSATRAKIWHKVSSTMGVQEPRTRYLRMRNIIGFYRRYGRGLTYFLMFLFTLFRGIFITIRDIWNGQFNLVVPLWRGWWDGWTGNFAR